MEEIVLEGGVGKCTLSYLIDFHTFLKPLPVMQCLCASSFIN